MMNQIKTSIAFLLVAMLLMALQCDDEYPLEEFKYNFEEKVDILPAKKSYKLGDTIWVKFQNDDKRLFDVLTNQDIPADSVALSFKVYLEGTFYAPFRPPGGHCDFITSDKDLDKVTRRPGDDGASLSISYGCTSPQRFEIGIVLKQRGIYKLNLDQRSNFNRVVSCTNQPADFPVSTLTYKFNVADANKDVYLSIPPISRSESPAGTTEREIDQKHIFMVRVE